MSRKSRTSAMVFEAWTEASLLAVNRSDMGHPQQIQKVVGPRVQLWAAGPRSGYFSGASRWRLPEQYCSAWRGSIDSKVRSSAHRVGLWKHREDSEGAG